MVIGLRDRRPAPGGGKIKTLSPRTIELIAVISALVFVVVWVVGVESFRDRHYVDRFDRIIEAVVSFEAPKNQFIRDNKDKVKQINSKIDDVECYVMLSSVWEHCLAFELDTDMVMSLITVESQFTKDAVSSAGAVGYMQIMPETAELVAWRLGMMDYDLTKTKHNIRIGCCYLALLWKFSGSEEEVLGRYYAGRAWKQLGGEYSESVIAGKGNWM